MAVGYWDVLQGYLYMAVDLGPLAAQAVLRPGGDICGETLPNIPEGDEVAGRPPARMGGPVEMFENLLPKVPGYWRAEHAGGGVADEVKGPDLLCDDAQTWTGMESLYLWAEDLAEGPYPGMTCRRWLRRPGRSQWWQPLGGTARPLPHLTYLVHTPVG
jgi:hypothetical protein